MRYREILWTRYCVLRVIQILKIKFFLLCWRVSSTPRTNELQRWILKFTSGKNEFNLVKICNVNRSRAIEFSRYWVFIAILLWHSSSTIMLETLDSSTLGNEIRGFFLRNAIEINWYELTIESDIKWKMYSPILSPSLFVILKQWNNQALLFSTIWKISRKKIEKSVMWENLKSFFAFCRAR